MEVLPYLEIAGRSVAVYGAVIIAFRLAGKKHVAELSLIDFILILLVSDAVQSAMVGENTTIAGGIVAAVSLIAMNVVLTKLIVKSKKIAKVIEGEPVLLVRNGKFLRKNLADQSLREEEVYEAMHENGIAKVSDVAMAILETDGSISIIPKESKQHG
jgi:uncharacterized membrane protein YcaP (DUF421 family)